MAHKLITMRNSKKRERPRGFCFTDYKLNLEFYDQFKKEGNYIIAGEEICPSTGRIHYQGYIHFKNGRSYEKLRKIFDSRHIEIAGGSPDQNFNYCTEDEKIVINYGIKPEQGKRNDLIEIKQEIDNGSTIEEIADNHFPAWCRYHNAFDIYKDMKQTGRNWETEVIVLWGDSGTGKTRTAVEAGGEIVRWDGKFMDNYRNQEIVIFDDFQPGGKMDREDFVMFTDRYDITVNVKNKKNVKWNPKTIYITSNYDPITWYMKDGQRDLAVERRLTKVTQMKVAQK